MAYEERTPEDDRFDEIIKMQGLNIQSFHQEPPIDLFPNAQYYPQFFNQNLVNPNRVLKQFLDDPQSNIRVFYIQLLRLAFEVPTDSGYNHICLQNFKKIVFHPEFEILFTPDSEGQRQIYNDFQFKKLFAEFISLLITASESEPPSIEQAIDQFPIIDIVLIHIIRSLLVSFNIKVAFDQKISTDLLFKELSSVLQLSLTSYGNCWKFEQSDMFCYEENENELYMAYIADDYYSEETNNLQTIESVQNEERYIEDSFRSGTDNNLANSNSGRNIIPPLMNEPDDQREQDQGFEAEEKEGWSEQMYIATNTNTFGDVKMRLSDNEPPASVPIAHNKVNTQSVNQAHQAHQVHQPNYQLHPPTNQQTHQQPHPPTNYQTAQQVNQNANQNQNTNAHHNHNQTYSQPPKQYQPAQPNQLHPPTTQYSHNNNRQQNQPACQPSNQASHQTNYQANHQTNYQPNHQPYQTHHQTQSQAHHQPQHQIHHQTRQHQAPYRPPAHPTTQIPTNNNSYSNRSHQTNEKLHYGPEYLGNQPTVISHPGNQREQSNIDLMFSKIDSTLNNINQQLSAVQNIQHSVSQSRSKEPYANPHSSFNQPQAQPYNQHQNRNHQYNDQNNTAYNFSHSRTQYNPPYQNSANNNFNPNANNSPNYPSYNPNNSYKNPSHHQRDGSYQSNQISSSRAVQQESRAYKTGSERNRQSRYKPQPQSYSERFEATKHQQYSNARQNTNNFERYSTQASLVNSHPQKQPQYFKPQPYVPPPVYETSKSTTNYRVEKNFQKTDYNQDFTPPDVLKLLRPENRDSITRIKQYFGNLRRGNDFPPGFDAQTSITRAASNIDTKSYGKSTATYDSRPYSVTTAVNNAGGHNNAINYSSNYNYAGKSNSSFYS